MCEIVAALQVLCLFLVACAMAFSLAHAAELPGKMRLDEDQYRAIQPIYHPGFTIGGISEPLAILALLVLIFTNGLEGQRWLLLASSLGLMIGVQLVYWLAVHPINRFWLVDSALPKASARFFGTGAPARTSASADHWAGLRNRWEYAHATRAVLAVAAFLLLSIDVATR